MSRPKRATRHEYLKQLVNEFKYTPDFQRKEGVTADLANFAYDPINYTSHGRLRIMDLFLGILNNDREAKNFKDSKKLSVEDPSPSILSRRVQKEQSGGICIGRHF